MVLFGCCTFLIVSSVVVGSFVRGNQERALQSVQREGALESARAEKLLALISKPITLLSAHTSSFDCSWSMEFEDSQRIVGEINMKEGNGLVTIRHGGKSEILPESSVAEKRVLLLLEEWIRGSPKATEANEQKEIWWDVEGEDVGIGIYRELKKRNL
jgi:hypothetical protein